jgi:hypothetical protein
VGLRVEKMTPVYPHIVEKIAENLLLLVLIDRPSSDHSTPSGQPGQPLGDGLWDMQTGNRYADHVGPEKRLGFDWQGSIPSVFRGPPLQGRSRFILVMRNRILQFSNSRKSESQS